MSDERDPLIESLFDEADYGLEDETFTNAVVDRVKGRRSAALVSRLAVLALLVALEVVLESPLQASLGVVADVLGMSLIELESEWLAFVLAPVNSIAGLLGITLLALNALYRRLLY